MLTINLICVGKLKEAYWRGAQEEYSKRLSAFCRLNIIELAEYRLPNDPSDSQIEKCILQEGESILQKIKGYAISLCIEGKQVSSNELSTMVSEIPVGGVSEISFIIGGSYGLSDPVKARADFKMSMSKMTFPHQLARIMILEQVYRAFQIGNNSKYHK